MIEVENTVEKRTRARLRVRGAMRTRIIMRSSVGKKERIDEDLNKHEWTKV